MPARAAARSLQCNMFSRNLGGQPGILAEGPVQREASRRPGRPRLGARHNP